MSKIDTVLKKINKLLRDIFNNDPNFSGDINLSLHLGGLININKKEKIKIK